MVHCISQDPSFRAIVLLNRSKTNTCEYTQSGHSWFYKYMRLEGERRNSPSDGSIHMLQTIEGLANRASCRRPRHSSKMQGDQGNWIEVAMTAIGPIDGEKAKKGSRSKKGNGLTMIHLAPFLWAGSNRGSSTSCARSRWRLLVLHRPGRVLCRIVSFLIRRSVAVSGGLGL